VRLNQDRAVRASLCFRRAKAEDVAATFCRLPRSRVIHEDLAHQLRRYSEEVGAALPLRKI